jgi:TolB protein
MSRRNWLALIAGLLSMIIAAGTVLLLALGIFLWTRPAGAQLLIFGGRSDLRLLQPYDDGNGRLLADNASSDLFRYPAVAPDGRRIAYVAREDGAFVIYQLLIGTSERRELYRSAEHAPLHLVWSPDGTTLSFLGNMRGGGLGLFLVDIERDGQPQIVARSTGTYYFAWTPAGDELLLHIGGSAVRGGRVATYRPADGRAGRVFDDPGLFQTPAWSVDGETLFYVVQPPFEGGPDLAQIESVLTGVGPDGETAVLAREPQAAILFSRAPNSDHIAYTTVSSSGFGELKVIDPSDGSLKSVSRPGEQISAFFWSPSGDRLAYLSTVVAPGSNRLPSYTWHLVDRGGNAVQDLAGFTPSRSFAAMVNFFDAYVNSFSVWSPDGRYLAYGAEDGVYVIDTNRPGREPQLAGEGGIGSWVSRR